MAVVFSDANTVNSVFLVVVGPVVPDMTPVDDDRVRLPPKTDRGGDTV